MVGVQQELFSLDSVRIGEAFYAMAKFHFDEAAEIFGEALICEPDSALARTGLEMIRDWREILDDLEWFGGEELVQYFWSKLSKYPFGKEPGPSLFRTELVKRLIQLMEKISVMYLPSGLCIGYLFLQAGMYEKAERALKSVLVDHPHNGRLMGYLGDSLWMQGRKMEARAAYTKTLLIAPADLSLEEIKDMEVSDLVAAEGREMAPVRGWLEGLFPLLDVEADAELETIAGNVPTGRKGRLAYTLLSLAEKARRIRQHEEMVSYRKRLKSEAPDIFEAYMEHLERRLD